MASASEIKMDAFLKEECHLEGESLFQTTTIFENMGLKTRLQLLEYLSNQSVTDLIKLGLLESQAAAIMNHSHKTLPIHHKTTIRIFPRLSNKYLVLEIIGYAFVYQEAIDMCHLSHNSRLFYITNFQLFKRNLMQAEKIEINSVFELLDERWLSKRYRLCYKGGKDSLRDMADCFQLLDGRLNLYSISIQSSCIHMLSKIRPQKVTIYDCNDIPELFKHLPQSVTCLELDDSSDKFDAGEFLTPRKFRKLTLLKCEQTLAILFKYATATESFTIDCWSLDDPGIIDYLTQMDCKHIIIETFNLLQQQLRYFFNCQSKAIKLIQHFYNIKASQIENVEWFNHFTSKSVDRVVSVVADIDSNNAAELFERLFNGSFSQIKYKSIVSYDGIFIETNVCLPNTDTKTESLSTCYLSVAVLALNNCTRLTKLELLVEGNCKYQVLAVEKLILRELKIMNQNSTYDPLISDIVKKSKDTLQSLTYGGSVDLSPLKYSKVLKQLRIELDIILMHLK